MSDRPPTPDSGLRLGISACLLGMPVRYDGGHKHHPLFSEPWTREIRFFPFCPEVGCGLGVPREPMRLEGDPQQPALRTLHSGIDHTRRLQQWGHACIRKHQAEGITGYLLKSRSPSCGMTQVPVCTDQGTVPGMGLFPQMLLATTPPLLLAEGDLIQDTDTLLTLLHPLRATPTSTPPAATRERGA